MFYAINLVDHNPIPRCTFQVAVTPPSYMIDILVETYIGFMHTSMKLVNVATKSALCLQNG